MRGETPCPYTSRQTDVSIHSPSYEGRHVGSCSGRDYVISIHVSIHSPRMRGRPVRDYIWYNPASFYTLPSYEGETMLPWNLLYDFWSFLYTPPRMRGETWSNTFYLSILFLYTFLYSPHTRGDIWHTTVRYGYDFYTLPSYEGETVRRRIRINGQQISIHHLPHTRGDQLITIFTKN